MTWVSGGYLFVHVRLGRADFGPEVARHLGLDVGEDFDQNRVLQVVRDFDIAQQMLSLLQQGRVDRVAQNVQLIPGGPLDADDLVHECVVRALADAAQADGLLAQIAVEVALERRLVVGFGLTGLVRVGGVLRGGVRLG